jgi:hypothetical protein
MSKPIQFHKLFLICSFIILSAGVVSGQKKEEENFLGKADMYRAKRVHLII